MDFDKSFKYAAFISYSRADLKITRALHRALESVYLPLGFPNADGDEAGRRRFGPVFLDTEELPADPGLRRSLHRYLDQSKALIVVCSPEASQSPWVKEEIEYFQSLGRSDSVFCVLVPSPDGIPDDTMKSFPAPLLLDGLEPPLAADMRNPGQTAKRAAMQLVAGIFGLSLDAIVNRQRRQRRNFLKKLALTATIVAAFVILGATILIQRNIAERDGHLMAESVSAAEVVDRIIRENGDTTEALKVAIGALPGARAGGNRPHVVAAEAALFKALQANKLERTFDGHTEQITSIAVSHNEQWLASGSTDKTVRLWSINGSSEARVLQGHAGSILDVKFLDNDRLVASASSDATVRIWEVQSGKLVAALTEHRGPVVSMVPSPDGKRLATLSTDGTARLWNLADYRSIVLPHIAADFVPNWGPGAAARPWKEINVSERATGNWGFMQPKRFSYQGLGVTSLKWTPQGDIVLTSGEDGHVRRWQANDGALLADFSLSKAPVYDLAVNFEQGWFVAGSEGLGSIGDLRTGVKLSDLERAIIKSDVPVSITDLELSGDGRHIIGLVEEYYAQGSALYSWEVPSGRFSTRIQTPERQKVNSFVFQAQPPMTISAVGRPPRESPLILDTGQAPENIALMTWIGAQGQFSIPFVGHKSAVMALSLFQNRPSFVSGDFSGQIRIWKMGLFDFDPQWLSNPNDPGRIGDADWSPSTNLGAVVNQDGVVLVSELDKALPGHFLQRKWLKIGAVTESTTGLRQGDFVMSVEGKPVHTRDELIKTLEAAGKATTVSFEVWRDGGLQKAVATLRRGQENSTSDMPFPGVSMSEVLLPEQGLTTVRLSLDGRYLFVGSWDGSLTRYDSKTEGNATTMVSLGAPIVAIEHDQTGGLFVAVASNGQAAFWKQDGAGPVKTMALQKTNVKRVVLAPDGEHVALFSDDNIHVYTLPTGKLVAAISPEDGGDGDGSFTPDGRYFFAAAAREVPDMHGVVTRIDTNAEKIDTAKIDYYRYHSVAAVDAGHLAIADYDFTIHMVDFDARKITKKINFYKQSPRLLVSPDARRLIAFSAAQLKIFDIETGATLLDRAIPGDPMANMSLRVFPDAGRILHFAGNQAVLETIPVDTQKLIDVACGILPEAYRTVQIEEESQPRHICSSRN